MGSSDTDNSPLFTTVGYLTTQFTMIIQGPCENLVRPPVTVMCPICDRDGFYALQRITIYEIVTPLQNGMCYVLQVWIVETYHSNEICRTYERPEDLSVLEEWLSYVDPIPFNWDIPPVDYPKQYLAYPEIVIHPETGSSITVCKNDVKPSFKMACVNGFIKITRELIIKIATPLPSGYCRIIEHISVQSFSTNEPCESDDWEGAPPGATLGYDPVEIWEEAVIAGELPEDVEEEGTFRVGREWDRKHPLRKQFRELQRKESTLSGSNPDMTIDRWVVVSKINEQPANLESLSKLTPPHESAVIEIRFEGSKVSSTIEISAFGVINMDQLVERKLDQDEPTEAKLLERFKSKKKE